MRLLIGRASGIARPAALFIDFFRGRGSPGVRCCYFRKKVRHGRLAGAQGRQGRPRGGDALLLGKICDGSGGWARPLQERDVRAGCFRKKRFHAEYAEVAEEKVRTSAPSAPSACEPFSE